VVNSTTRKHEGIAGGGTAFLKIVGMGRIKVSTQLEMVGGFREGREFWVIGQNVEWDGGKIFTRSRAPINNSPVNGGAKI
jgi:hypothetical protein